MTPGEIIDETMLEQIKKLEDVWKDVDPEEHSVIKKELEKQQSDRLNT